MKRKISLFLCVLITALGLAGCSDSDKTVQYDEAALQQVTETMIVSLSQMEAENFQQFRELSDYKLEYTMMQSGLPVKGEDFLSMIGSWEAAEDECGAYVSHGEYEMEASGKDVTVTTLAEYEDRQADIVFKFDEDLNLTSMDVSAPAYSSDPPSTMRFRRPRTICRHVRLSRISERPRSARRSSASRPS